MLYASSTHCDLARAPSTPLLQALTKLDKARPAEAVRRGRALCGFSAQLIFALCLGIMILSAPNSGWARTSLEQSDRNPYDVPREEFSIPALKNGYSAKRAYELSARWNLQKFLDITEPVAFSYMNLAEFLPHAIIRRDGPVAFLQSKPNPALSNISLKDADGNSVTLNQMISADDTSVQGVMVLHRGAIVFEAYPGMRRTDNHVWMSNTKVLSSLLIAQLEQEGKIDVQKTVGDYLSDAKGTAWEPIKVIDILNMQSGLDLEESPASRKGDTPYGRFVRAEVGVPNNDGKILTHNQALLSIPRLGDSGTAFEYSSANTQMLGLLIEEVAGVRLNEALTERVWAHAGMDGDATLGLSPQGNGIIHGLVSSRLIDMAKFGLLYTPSWNKTASKRIVSEEMIKKIQTAGRKENYLKGTLGPHLAAAFRETPMANAYQWDAVFSDGDIYKSGMNGQGLYVSPERDVVIVWFATGGAKIEMEAFARKIAKSL